MKQNQTVCFICGAKINTSVCIPYSDDTSKTREYVFFPCCSYYRQRKFLVEKEIAALYKKNYRVFHYEGLNFHKRLLILYLKAFGFRRYIKGKDILEIGAATGDYLHICRKFQPASLSGVELSKHASDVAKKRYGFNFVNKDVDTFKTKKKFDTIFMFHVIEHLKDPSYAMHSYSKLLKKGGTLIMETPNVDSWEYGLFKYDWLNLSVPLHTYLYSTKTFLKMKYMTSLTLVKIIFASVSNVMPDQFKLKGPLSYGELIVSILFLPFSFLSSLFQKSGVITVFFQKQK